MIYLGGAFLALGLTMWTRGMIYTLWPTGRVAEKRKRRNLKLGFTTDMKVFGRKVRRLGFLIAILGGLATAWELSGEAEATEAGATEAGIGTGIRTGEASPPEAGAIDARMPAP